MELNDLPTEVLENIFELVRGEDLFACRKVCARWKEILHSSDCVWRNACRRELGEGHQEARGRARLSWAELYTSLSLWPGIHTAIKQTRQLVTSPSKRFEVLQNGTIGVPTHDRHVDGEIVCNTIVYYDIDTYEECHRENIYFDFIAYNENERYIAVADTDGQICVKHKENKRCFLVGNIHEDRSSYMCYCENRTLQLLGNLVYFKNINRGYIWKLVEHNGNVTAEAVVVEHCDNYNPIFYSTEYIFANIISVSSADSNNINILAIDGVIVSCDLLNRRMISKAVLDVKTSRRKIRSELISFGFRCRSPPVLKWMVEFRQENTSYANALKSQVSAIYAHGNIIVLGKANCMLHIYYRPYSNTIPIRSFDLKAIFKLKLTTLWIKQIDIVEMLNGHKLIVLMEDQIYVLELMHKLHNDDNDDGDSCSEPWEIAPQIASLYAEVDRCQLK